MPTDSQTNYLFLADSLPKKYASFYSTLKALLDDQAVKYSLLPGTKDVWAVDYMPIQLANNEFVQFVYNPDYLRNSARWRKTISDVDFICRSLSVEAKKSEIVFDGGNLVRTSNKAIICDKIFKENSSISRRDLRMKIIENLEIEDLIIIPTDPLDFTGHADGVVRFYDGGTVFVNNYGTQDKDYKVQLESVLTEAGLTIIPVPYNPYDNHSDSEANGTYLNYLQMEGLLLIPVFDKPEDDEVLCLFEQSYKKETIKTINCNEIAKDGGILNCISWNIRTERN